MSEAVRSGGSCEVVFTRLIRAPRELVFKAWTDPKHLARWWGPRGMTNPVCEVDARPGGAWRTVMRSEDGNEYPCRGVFLEIVEPERLVLTVGAHDHPADWQEQLAALGGKSEGDTDLNQVWTVTLEAQDGGTLMTVRNRFESAAARDAALEMGHAEGAGQSMDRLVELMEAESVASREIRVTRVVNAPRELVFKCWTSPEHIAHWWGPNGFTITIFEMDVRPGGIWRFVMHGPDGVDYQNRIEFVEISPPERLVLNHVSGPTFLLTVEFTDLGDRTEVSVQSLFDSAQVRDQVIRQVGADEGLRQNVDRLVEYVSTL